MNGDFDALFNARFLRGGNGGEPLVFGLLAWFAAFWGIFKSFIAKENLFTDCPDEILTAIDAMYI